MISHIQYTREKNQPIFEISHATKSINILKNRE